MDTKKFEFERRDFLKKSSVALTTLGSSSLSSSLLLPSNAFAEEANSKPLRASYFCNGELHIGEIGKGEGTAITKGFMDFKPSWSRTEDKLIFFRRIKDSMAVNNWKTAISIIGSDGSDLHHLSDGTKTDFNPTWTRDGLNTPIWNRKNDKKGSFYVMQGKVGGKPGEEIQLTDDSYHTWVFSTLTDGRLLVQCDHPKMGWGNYLMTRGEGTKPLFEKVECQLAANGLLDRVSISPDEKKVCFEYQRGFNYVYHGRTLYIADFDAAKRSITNMKPIANADGKMFWFAYPRWIGGDSSVIYQASDKRFAEQCQLMLYKVSDNSTTKVSTNPASDYRYPHGEAQPC